MKSFSQIWKNWRQNSQYKAVIQVCFPLVVSTATVTVMEFTDRVFLSNFSINAISAATPAGVASLFFIVFFSGVAGYGSVFIAQYCGAASFLRVGAVVWQTIYFSLLSGIIMFGISFLAVPIFDLVGHGSEIRKLEIMYFKWLCCGALLHILQTGLSSFFSGRGRTRPIMVINILGMIINIPLDYALINGVWGFPRLGITGAAMATVFSWGFILVCYAFTIFTRSNDHRYRVKKAYGFDKDLFVRMMKYGIPGSVQFCLDIFAFMFFIFMIGRIGKTELATSNIVISINSLAFMPVMGCSLGVSTLVGQALGKRQPKQAQHAVKSTIHLLLLFVCLMDVIYLFFPHYVISWFIPSGQAASQYATIIDTGKKLLRIVSCYLFMDAMYMTFVGALKGAGDTKFIMYSIGSASLMVMIVPVYIGIEYLRMGIYYAWMCATLFIASLFLLSFWRYRTGKWQNMLVMEQYEHE